MSNATQPNRSFAQEVVAEPGGEVLYRCFSCGTCAASCPISWLNTDFNPRRIIKMAVFGMREEVLSSPVIWYCSACDICYRRCPQGIHISDLMAAIRNIAAREGYQRLGPIAQVNERTCVACGLCVEVCPYEAITLVDKRVLGREKTVAQVDRFRCLSCGICAASCRSASIDVVEFNDEALLSRIRGLEEGALLPVEAMV